MYTHRQEHISGRRKKENLKNISQLPSDLLEDSSVHYCNSNASIAGLLEAKIKWQREGLARDYHLRIRENHKFVNVLSRSYNDFFQYSVFCLGIS